MGMDERPEHPVTMVTATDEERALAREHFRRNVSEAESRMTPEKRAKALAIFGIDASTA
ncbi:hypothetical protein Vau01_117150 [Virgisporangium aurantiacum]|uniref:Uncharacterized protein n=2 Tax=Virgisporangium aurantiacum TaxID=175570 RepID=A0A8J3ZHW3_9ACTN|nr:hypothetical protein Vau01_117150 [Virgisporangium aurantiacum]